MAGACVCSAWDRTCLNRRVCVQVCGASTRFSGRAGGLAQGHRWSAVTWQVCVKRTVFVLGSVLLGLGSVDLQGDWLRNITGLL
jgi:hypothetical protein